MSYALFLHDEYPPFEFAPAAGDDGHARHTGLSIDYPAELSRWKPLYKWLLAVPHYVVIVALVLASAVTVLWGAFAVIVTGEYCDRARRFLVGTYRYCLRVEA